MTDNIIEFPLDIHGDIPTDKVVEAALGQDLESVLVLGWLNDGVMYMSGSSANVLEVIATLDLAKAALLKDMLNEGEF